MRLITDEEYNAIMVDRQKLEDIGYVTMFDDSRDSKVPKALEIEFMSRIVEHRTKDAWKKLVDEAVRVAAEHQEARRQREAVRNLVSAPIHYVMKTPAEIARELSEKELPETYEQMVLRKVTEWVAKTQAGMQ